MPTYSFIDRGDLETPIRVALLVGAALDTAPAILLWKIGKRIGLGVTGIAVALSGSLGTFVLSLDELGSRAASQIGSW